MATHAHVPWAHHHLPATPAPEVAPFREPEEQVVYAFELAAIGYLAAVLGPVLLLVGGMLPSDAVDGWSEIYFMAGCLPLALSVLAGVLYGLPLALGTRLWSVPLAWTHFAMLNSALLVPIWRLAGGRLPAGISIDQALAGVIALQAFGLAAMLANLVETGWHARAHAPAA